MIYRLTTWHISDLPINNFDISYLSKRKACLTFKMVALNGNGQNIHLSFQLSYQMDIFRITFELIHNCVYLEGIKHYFTLPFVHKLYLKIDC